MLKLRLCFAGTPAFASAHLLALYKSRHEIAAVITQPDRQAGRGKKIQASSVKELALSLALPVFQPTTLKSDQQEQLIAELKPDLLVVVAYGLILPKSILEIPKFGCINVHASLLPRWRGAAPIERALLGGDKETGVTIIQMDEGLDTGNMLMSVSTPIDASDTRRSLEDKLAILGASALVRVLDDLEEYQKTPVKQDASLSTYAAKLDKSAALIDWSQTAEQVNRQIRAGLGRSPAYTFIDRQRLRIITAHPRAEVIDERPGTVLRVEKDCLTIACKESVLDIYTIQLPGKSVMHIRDLLNSRPDYFAPGKILMADESSI